MAFEPIVNINSVKDKIAYQYREATNLIEYINVLLAPFDELEEVFADILNKRMWDNTTTDTLDIWGSIVVQDRGAYDATQFPFFGLDADDVNNPFFHKGLGDLDDLSVGGIFRSIEQPLATILPLSNQDYEKTITGKEHKNNFKGGVEAIYDTLVAIYDFVDPGACWIEEVYDTPEDPYVLIHFYQQLTDVQKSYLALNVLPKPGGIRFEYDYSVGLDIIQTSDGLEVETTDNNQLRSRRA